MIENAQKGGQLDKVTGEYLSEKVMVKLFGPGPE